jgi:predicted secreted protein
MNCANLSKTQWDIINGTLLGSASIHSDGRYYVSKRSKYKQYIFNIKDSLFPFVKKVNKRRVGDSFSWYIRSYIAGVDKQIPKNLIINDLILSYWFMDVGANIPSKRCVYLPIKSFDENLIDQLQKLGISATKQKKVIAVSCRDYFKFMSIVSPHVRKILCMNHKIDITGSLKTREGWGARKLSAKKAEEIRSLYFTDKYSQRELAGIYDVSIGTIWKVINNKIYHMVNFGFSGSADYKLILPPRLP